MATLNLCVPLEWPPSTVSCRKDKSTVWANVIERLGFFRQNMSGVAHLRFIALITVLVGSTQIARAQFTYSLDQSAPVEIDGRELNMPWAGGLNSAQINKIDFDGDGKEDVVVFDRAGNKLLPFRNVGNRYEYAPEFGTLFPPSVSNWMLLRDFNCDGKKDLFTSDPFGIAVFVNTTKAGQPLSWRAFNPGFPLLTKGFNGDINLKINDVDLPAIDDVDNDGDLDILAMRFVGIGTVEWHKNMSVEKTGRCDSLQLERVTQTYGGVQECTCGVFAFGGQPCPSTGGRVQHVGGKTLLTIDADGDGDRDLLFSEETCSTLYLLRNVGTNAEPNFTSASPFPASASASFPLFPGPYYEDIDFDDKPDLIVSPNLYARTFTNVLVKNSLWTYKNFGTAQQPNFTFSKFNFLQEDMIELGDYTTPALVDSDGDGDEDLFVGIYGNENFRGVLYYFENVGTESAPSFKLVDSDYGSLSSLPIYNLKPQFADMNGDGKIDLAFTCTSLVDGITRLLYAPNSKESGLQLDFGNLVETSFRIGQSENLRVADVNADGTPDLLVGKATGALQYWENGSNNGFFSVMTLKNSAFMGLGISTSRQNPSVAIGDLDGDGLNDLVMGDQRGNISIFGDYKNFNSTISTPASEVVYNPIVKSYQSINFGGRIAPAIGNIFNSSKPSLVLGNTLGGLHILRNDEGQDLPEVPVIGVGPSPLLRTDELMVKSDRNVRVQIFSILGQKMCDPFFIQANQTVPVPLQGITAGVYIARFIFPNRSMAVKFVVLERRD